MAAVSAIGGPEWTCSICTLSNPARAMKCSACEAWSPAAADTASRIRRDISATANRTTHAAAAAHTHDNDDDDLSNLKESEITYEFGAPEPQVPFFSFGK
jgi:predicted ATP-dependent serine protease